VAPDGTVYTGSRDRKIYALGDWAFARKIKGLGGESSIDGAADAPVSQEGLTDISRICIYC